jgi:hypothetical protein
MLEENDVPGFFRDLYKLTEDEFLLLDKSQKLERVRDNLIKKQIILARIIAIFNSENK